MNVLQFITQSLSSYLTVNDKLEVSDTILCNDTPTNSERVNEAISQTFQSSNDNDSSSSEEVPVINEISNVISKELVENSEQNDEEEVEQNDEEEVEQNDEEEVEQNEEETEQNEEETEQNEEEEVNQNEEETEQNDEEEAEQTEEEEDIIYVVLRNKEPIEYFNNIDVMTDYVSDLKTRILREYKSLYYIKYSWKDLKIDYEDDTCVAKMTLNSRNSNNMFNYDSLEETIDIYKVEKFVSKK
jgi:hypothetical protein